MRILLAAQVGLFADAFCGSLTKLAREVEIERCDPERLQDPGTEAGFALVLIDADAAPGRAAALVHSCRERLPDGPIVALGSGLDEGLIAGIMDAGAETYFPKTYREVQALGVLQVVLGGTNHRQHSERSHVAPRAELPGLPPSGRTARRGGPNPYSLTDRELQVLTLVCEGRSNLNVAKRLGIVEGTVKIHLSNSYKKMGVENRTQAIRIVERMPHVQNMVLEQAVENVSVRDWLLPHMSTKSITKARSCSAKATRPVRCTISSRAKWRCLRSGSRCARARYSVRSASSRPATHAPAARAARPRRACFA